MINKINEKLNIFNDNIAYVEIWDFSKANMSEENRIKAITTVASICYQNPKAIGSESLYNRLLAESKGLPSSSFEFVPILIPLSKIYHRLDVADIHISKFGEIIKHNAVYYLLTNFRAIVYDVENTRLEETWLKFFNTEEDCEIIKQHFKVFLYKVDLPTRSQMVRHRVNWQELSRRYVSGERVPFEFYVSEKMKNVKSLTNPYGYECDTQDIVNMCLDHYKQALEQGVKPQEARRIIPQCAYTQIWGAFMPKQLENYFKLRLDESAQWEIRQTAIAMHELIRNKKEVKR
ncbi:FAD-dependent thymidylate synthase [Aliarcobacter cibarius]|uniref:FAD-dependent thymidylate synthase n=1 Tax=Aliarcobacter cibarius TaxID=255507 RepID=A0ABY2V5J8_9BACT|nr:FAD-dependent thymidylate synthase [Aliarcobacter cibarius]TLS99903.1 FAD-dependent thymidylate synthase [Aliarcobacter cibarius]TLT00312.1 FAD-dependent thymidylate synthase [Aliarcobacter cibarius]